MKVIHNNIIPLKGYKAMTIWPFIFVRGGVTFTPTDERHEEIHGEQQKEMLVVPFYVWYVAEWLVRIMLMGFTGEWWNTHRAYRDISLEREAYGCQDDAGYLSRRRHYAWVRYIFKNKDNN